MRGFTLAVLAGLSVAAAASPAAAEERMPTERWTHPYSGTGVPPCEAPEVASKIISRFSETDSLYWRTGLQIARFDAVKTTDFRPWGLDFIPRRFCRGVVTMSDGVRRDISYVLAEDTGMIGWGWGVRFCINGLDPSLAYAPACKMAQP
jgi:hypothetical protein